MLGIILAAVLFSWQTARISALYAQRFEARGMQVNALGIDRDLQDLMATYERLLYVKDPCSSSETQRRVDRTG